MNSLGVNVTICLRDCEHLCLCVGNALCVYICECLSVDVNVQYLLLPHFQTSVLSVKNNNFLLKQQVRVQPSFMFLLLYHEDNIYSTFFSTVVSHCILYVYDPKNHAKNVKEACVF